MHVLGFNVNSQAFSWPPTLGNGFPAPIVGQQEFPCTFLSGASSSFALYSWASSPHSLTGRQRDRLRGWVPETEHLPQRQN